MHYLTGICMLALLASCCAGRSMLGATGGSSDFAAQMKSYYQGNSFFKTQFAASVDPSNPLPEHPKPHFQRPNSWQSLNGIWEVENTTSTVPPFGQTLQQQIVVPFPVEAPMSGVHAHSTRLTYRLLFSPTRINLDDHVILHVERADYQASVFVNQQAVGTHKGGYDAFEFDITEQLAPSGQNELIIQVEDDTELAMQPIGKQRAIVTSDILYTSVTGIWGSVWVEVVPAAHIIGFEFYPDVDAGVVRVTVHGSPAAGSLSAKVTVFDGSYEDGPVVGWTVVSLDTEAVVEIPNAKLWHPDTPYLYNATIILLNSAGEVSTSSIPKDDKVFTYFGMRKVAIQKDTAGVPRITLNNQFIFQWGMLDQIPEGIYTYPSDEAMLFDLQFQKSTGANMVRKHMKVESDRWYYHCDRLGLLVWQDMPAMCGVMYPNSNTPNPDPGTNKDGWDSGTGAPGGHPCWITSRVIDEPAKQQWRNELREIVDEHVFSPSVIYYSIFNEAWGQFDTPEMTQFALSLDPTHAAGRSHFLVSGASGWVQADGGNVIDQHDYGMGGVPPLPHIVPNVTGGDRAGVFGEYGGLKWRIDGHTYSDNKPVGTNECDKDLVCVSADALQRNMINQTLTLGTYLDKISGAVFTQVTDVERELNGLLTYDRAVNKLPDFAAYTALIKQLIANSTRYSISN